MALILQTFNAFAHDWTALGGMSLQDIWSTAHDQCSYSAMFPINDLKESIDIHRSKADRHPRRLTANDAASMGNSLEDLKAFMENVGAGACGHPRHTINPTERQRAVKKAEAVLLKMRAKTERYDDARQEVISSVAKRPPATRKLGNHL